MPPNSEIDPVTASSPSPELHRNHRILIIDDNPLIHEDVRKILGVEAEEDAALDAEAAELFGNATPKLKTVDFEIDSAFQGQEGLEMVQAAMDEERPYAMAFVDVRMPPGWDGIETISRIWKKYPDLQVVICTAYSDYSWEEMIRKVGHTDSLVILKKPFDNVEVLQLAHTLTRKWTLSHQLRSHLHGLDHMVSIRTEELQTANLRLREEMADREQMQHELRLSEERFAKAFQASPIPMTIQSLETGRYLDVNESFLAMIGHGRMEVISRTPAELDLCVDPADAEEFLHRLRGERSMREFECLMRTRNDGVRECVFFAETFALGTEEVALVATLDVSEQRRLEKQLRHAQKLEAVGQLAAGVAHDFNNILTIIQGHATMHLAASNLEGSLANSFKQVSDAAERASALTRQLLAFSRKQIVQPRVLDLNAVVQGLQEMLSRLIGSHIALACEMGSDLPAVYADEANLEQIVVNLVVNARDAMPGGGRLTIRTQAVDIDEAEATRNHSARAGQFVCLTVKDTGCGMSGETLSHIFEPFFTTKEVGKGTGLGLATVYGIVAQHEGWIDVASKLNHGTSVAVFLPCSDDKAETTDRARETELRGGSETILFVEDEPEVREIVVEILGHHGYHVIQAADGIEALAVWAEMAQRIDILVTDIVMPNGLAGNVLAERLRAEKPNLKVIYSSGYSEEFATGAALLSQGAKFLQKPYKLDGLLKAVRDCLDG